MADGKTMLNLAGRRLPLYEDGAKVLTLRPGGHQFRLRERAVDVEYVDGVTVATVRLDLRSLPPEVAGRWIVVTQVAALGLALLGDSRRDILFPGPGVAVSGHLVGCRGLRRLAGE